MAKGKAPATVVLGALKIRAAPNRSCPFSVLTPERWPPQLRNVVAERGPNHVVDALGRDGRGADGHTAQARPGVFGKIGVLDAELHATLRTLVEPVPKSESALLDAADVACAICT